VIEQDAVNVIEERIFGAGSAVEAPSSAPAVKEHAEGKAPKAKKRAVKKNTRKTVKSAPKAKKSAPKKRGKKS
jgi:hypothetical protein